jgi:outer membrane lipoprotein SlyB
MYSHKTILALGLVASTLVTGCANYDSRPSSSSSPSSTSSYPSSTSSSYVSYGVIEEINTIRENTGIGGSGIGVGAVIGGVAGGVLGNQVGSGKGKTAATVVGAVGGAVVGNEIQKRNSQNQGGDAYRLRVRLDRGGYVTVTQRDIGDLRVGDQVRVENDTAYRY